MTRLKRQVFLISTALAAWLGLAGPSDAAAPVINYGAQAQPRNGAVAVQPGDTVQSIAKLYRLPVEDIIAYNDLKPPYALSPRQRLILPMPKEHKVGRDDTLYSLSRMYGVAPLQIAAANRIDPPYMLHPGQMLRIPAAATPPKSSATPSKTTAGTLLNPSTMPAHAAAASPYHSPTVKPLALKEKPAEAAPQTGKIAAPKNSTEAAMLKAPGPSPEHQAFDSLVSKIAGAENTRAAHAAAAAPPSLLSPFAKAPEDDTVYVSSSRNPNFIWPVRGQVISSYGPKAGGLYNDGINIAAPRGTPVKAAADGMVVYVGDKLQSYGNLVLIRHAGGMVTAYAHLNSVTVREGMSVKRGQSIGAVGSTGTVANAQLHFEVRKGKDTLDPKSYLG